MQNLSAIELTAGATVVLRRWHFQASVFSSKQCSPAVIGTLLYEDGPLLVQVAVHNHTKNALLLVVEAIGLPTTKIDSEHVSQWQFQIH